MRRDGKLRLASALLTAFVVLTATFWSAETYAQANRGGAAQTVAAGEADVAQSMGVGLKSRFASGATPIQLSRTSIVPGTPMSVNSTMSNIMTSGSNSSFGGILARYDTSNFGKFFGTGTLAPRAMNARVDALDNLTQTDNEVENVETERMYPPRLVLDFREHPIHSLKEKGSQRTMAAHIENVLSRYDFDPNEEEVDVSFSGSTVFLRGNVKSGRLSRLLESVVGIQAGVERVVNELEILEPETNNVDVFGHEIDQ